MRNIDEFKKKVAQRAECYDEIDIQTVAIKNNSAWINLHTDTYLRAIKDPDLPSQTMKSAGPAAYLRSRVSFDDTDGLIDCIEDLFTQTCHKEPVQFGHSDEDDEEGWQNDVNISDRNLREFDRANRATRMRILFRDESLFPDHDELNKQLRRADPPYDGIIDFTKDHLDHISYTWNQSTVRFFAPVYLRVTDADISDDGDFLLKIEAHESIDNLVVSTWALNEGRIVDRARHEHFDTESSNRLFCTHHLNWSPSENPDEVSYSVFHDILTRGELQKGIQSPLSALFQALEAILDFKPDELSQLLNDVLTNNRDICTKEEMGKSGGFEASIITLCSLAGFSAYSPEWFKQETDNESLPDVVASTDYYGSTILIWECAMKTEEAEMKKKADNALSNAENLRSYFDNIDRATIDVIPIYATPEDKVVEDMLPDSVVILTGEKLKNFKKLAEENTPPDDILNEILSG